MGRKVGRMENTLGRKENALAARLFYSRPKIMAVGAKYKKNFPGNV